MKKALGRLACLCAALCALACVLSACGGSGGTVKEAKWTKSHWDNGLLHIRTEEPIAGTCVAGDGSESDAGLVLYRDRDGFLGVVYSDSGNPYSNDTGADLAVAAYAIVEKDSGNEWRKEFSGSMASGDILVDMGGGGATYLPTLLGGEAEGAHVLELSMAGVLFRFPISGGTEYSDMWGKAMPLSYFPTYNDDLFDGDGVCDDLKKFLDWFEPAFMESMEYRKQFDAKTLLLADILNVGEDGKLKAGYNWFRSISDAPLLRQVDADYYNEVRQRIDAAMLEAGVREGGELLQDGMEVLDRVFDFFSEW